MFSRRGFIKVGSASVASLALRPFGLLPALAQSSSNYRALVCVFLFGGNDSNNMVVPMDDPSYRAYLAARGNLALQTSDLTAPIYSASQNAPYAFHSGLSELASMFANKELAVVANVGNLVQPTTRSQYQSQGAPVPSNLFSHSDQQLQWQTSIPSGHGSTGWAGRAADIVASQNSSSFPTFMSVAGNSLMGTGINTQPVAISPGGNLNLQGFNTTAPSQIRRNSLTSLLTVNSGLQLVQAANGIMANSIADAQMLDSALAGYGTVSTVFPATGIGNQLKQIAQIIKARNGLGMNRQIFFCSMGGFDTHTGQIATHKNLYPQLSQALAAFNKVMEDLGTQDDVTTFTESDFSRTFQSTTGDGSDHAWGSHHLVMGGAVRGGDIYGSFPKFQLGGPDDADTRGRWIPTTSIDQYGATLCSWFGISDAQLSSVFPNLANFRGRRLGFLG